MRFAILLVPLALGGCAVLQQAFAPVPVAAPADAVAPVAEDPAETAVTTPPPSPMARTVEDFDTTTEDERAAAIATPPPPSETRLGTTLATLGAPADPGIWIETALVDAPVMGRVEVAGTGRTVTLELRPSGGPEGSGSQISLPAMRLLEVPLTAIVELIVFRGAGDPA
jgi:hypothetical protein